MAGDLIRVVLADDHAVVRAGLKAVLGAARDIDVIGEASDGAEAVAVAERLRPDVVVMDLSTAGMDGLAATKALAARGPAPRVLVLTMHAEEEYLVPDEKARYDRLTDRERDVMRLVARGCSAPEIGERLFISPETVDTYEQRVNEKMACAHRADYVKSALELGLLAE